MASSASAPCFLFLDSATSNEPVSATCRRIGSEPLSNITSTTTALTTPVSPTPRRSSSYTRRSQKAIHRAAIRRIITVSNQQQQQQGERQQYEQHYSSTSSTCRYSSAPQLPRCSSDLSRPGAVTQAVLKDHHPCLLSSTNAPHEQRLKQEKHRAKSLSSSSQTTTPCTKATRTALPPSITTRRVISSSSCPCSCSANATATTPTSATSSTNSTAYYSISSSSSPLHTPSSSANTSIHSSASFPSIPLSSSSLSSASPSHALAPPSTSGPNISCSSMSCTSSFQLHTDPSSSSSSPFYDSTSPHHPSSSNTWRQGSTTLGRQHASSHRHNNPRTQQLPQHSGIATNYAGHLTAPAMTTADTPLPALHISLLLDQDEKTAMQRHLAGESVWKRIIQRPGETLFFGRLRSGSTTTATEAVTKIAPREVIFKPLKPPPRASATMATKPAPPLSLTIQQPPLRHPNETRSLDCDLTHRMCPPQKSECNEQVHSGRTDNDSAECFYSAVNALGKDEWIQDIDISTGKQYQLYQQSRWSSFGVAQDREDKGVAMSCSAWPQRHTIQQQPSPYSKLRPQGRSRRHHTRIGNDITIQRQPSLRRPLYQPQQEHQQKQAQKQQPHQTQTAYQPQPRAQTDATRQRRQLSARYMRYLSTKPLPLLSRSTSPSSSRSRKRSIGPTTTTSTRYYGSLRLNKPLPPIPTSGIFGGFPRIASKGCVDGLFVEQESYHEARSAMVDSDASLCKGGSKQELASLLPLQRDGGSKEAIDATTMEQGGGAEEKQDVEVDVDGGDGLPCSGDGSESKDVLIPSGDDSLDAVGMPSSTMPMSMSKDELVLALPKKEVEAKDASTHHQAATKEEEYSSTTKASTLPTTSSAPTTNPSPTSIAALSIKRLESFRFPLRKSPIDKSTSCSMAKHPTRLHLLHYHQHSHRHSLPYNIATAVYAHHLIRTAFEVCNHSEPLAASVLVSGSNTTLASTITAAAGVTALTQNEGIELGCSIRPQDTNSFSSSSSTTRLQGVGGREKDSHLEGNTTNGRRHDPGWVSDRHCHHIGHHHQQRLHLRRSESCSNISHHRPSLRFNSSKKALLSLQARRVNKPDAKVLRLPEIQTSSTTSSTATTTPIAGLLGHVLRGDGGQLGAAGSSSEDGGALSGLETSMATAVLLDTVRTSSTTTTLPLLSCDTQEFLSTEAAAPASATIDSLQDATDYQLRVSESGRVVVDSILTELTTSVKSEEDIMVKGDGNDSSTDTADIDNRPKDFNFPGHGNSDIRGQEQETNSSKFTTTTIAATVSGSTPKVAPEASSETNLPTALENAFKFIESGPVVIDAAEIKRFVKRSHALQELESTEQSYVDDLDVLVHVHLRILESKSWFPHNVHLNMHRCVMGLLALHRDFLSQIQVYKTTSESDYEKRAPLQAYRTLEVAFLGLSQDHKLYSQFCELRMRTVNEINRTVGQSTLSVLQKESKELMAQQGRPKSRTDLKDHLIKPIQRICRYPLLLKEILRLTSPNDPEYEFIDRAHECMKTLAQQMDETQRMVERKLLTEQFLKKLPETNFPRKSGVALTPLHTSSKSNPDSNNHHRRGSNNAIHPLSSRSIGPTSELELFESGQFGEGILPRNMTKIYARTLGSIVLAGALEYVIMPDMPIRLRYYGCFLFESMLIVVKAKKTSLYEPRQWLPLRLCELYETTSLDGYTRYGWRITYGQFRIDFGASCETERQAWMSALQTHIQAAKLAHARLPCDTSTLEAVVSSLPWNMARPPSPPISTLFSGATESMLMIESTSGAGAGLGLSRQVQVYQQPPSPTPSPWSTCSSAIPSPLMPPPPMATCSTSSTMMMAMSFMTNTGEPEKWNDRGTPGVSLDAYAQYYEQHIHPHAHEAMSAHAEANDPSRLGLTRHLSVESGCDDSPRGYGMAGTRTGNSSTSATTTGESCQQHDQGYNSLNRSHSQSRTRPANESNPLSARKSESAVSGSNGGHLLFPSTPSPWLVPDPRPRSHSFDVARVFASSHSGGIKPNQRNLVQSMFKDVSTENIWTTTTLATTANNNHHNLHSQPSPQLIPSASSSSPMSSRAGRYSTPLPFSYFNNNNPSTSTSNFGGSITLPPPTSPKVTAGMVSISGSSHGHSGSSTSGNNVGGEDDETPVSTLTLQSAGSSCSSLTSRLLRRRDSLTGTKGSPNGPSVLPSSCSSEKNEWDRRRSSATAAIVAATSALNFRKNSEPSPNTSTSNTQNQHHRRRLSIPDPVALLFNSNGYTDPAGGHAHPAQDGIYQKSSIKARAQLIEKQAAHGLTALFASAPSLAPPGRNNPKKGGSGFGSGKLKSSLSGQDLASSFTATSSSSASLASMSMNAGESLATGSLMTEADVDCEILNSLSNAAAEAARSRRGGAGGAGNSERVQRRSIGATLAMTSINDPANTTALSSSASSSVTGAAAAFSQGLRPSTSTHSLPVYFGSNSSSTHSLVYSSHATESHPRDTVEKIWMAMGRLTHKRNAEDRYGSSSSGKSQHSQQKQQMYTHGSNQSSGSFVGGTGGKVTSSPRSLRRSSTHVSNNPSPTVPSPGGTSLLATEASSRPSSMHMDDARTSTSNSSSGSRNHHRTVSESTVKSIDSATSLMSDGSIPHHQQVILGNMVSSSPSSVPRLALTPSGSVRSRSSSNSSVHSSLLSIHDQSNSLSHINDPQYHRHYRGNKQQEYDARQPLLPCSSTDHHRHGESGISGGMAIVTSSPCSSLRHSGSGSRNSISSSSASSLSPALHYHHQDSTHYQLQPSAFQDRTKALMTPSAVILPSAFQKGHHYPSATPHFDSASIQDRSKSLSILQNFSQASQKFRTMIRSPTAARIGRSRRGTVTNLSPITMDHGATPSGSQVQAVEEDESEVVGGGGVHGGDIDVEPLVSEKDMEENFGSEQQQQQQQQQRGVPDFTTITV